ncbi:MAG: hypothetical protein B7Z54_02555 [Sphingobacteriales bacterium 12-47-4]|nr:MAG: hypothetical protein B7Z54_02555 [Sphingobacteriales bacterium 12-47-4]
MLTPTTALRKIAALKKRIWCIQGGQGAGKTFSILIILINHASTNPGKQIYIASAELTKMRDTVIKDFIKIIQHFNLSVSLSGIDHGSPKCIFPNGSFIRFLGLDKEDVGKGLRSDVMFVNEANKVKFDTYRELTSRAKRIIIDYNPNAKFWAHKEVIPDPDCDYLVLTYKDNEFLSQEERNTILSYKRKGYKLYDDGNHVLGDDKQPVIINQYWANMWRVYGLGEVGQVEGRIYTWQPITVNEYLAIQKREYFYSDWGKVDPWAVGGLKYHDGNLYVHELNYDSENEIERRLPPEQMKAIRAGDNGEHEGLIGWMFRRCGIPYDGTIVCDSSKPHKINSARRAGWERAVAVGGKMDLVNRISVLSGLNIYYTETSTNIEMEQENYAYDKDKATGAILEKPIDQDNHHMDGIAYAVGWMFEEGIIKNV